MKYAQYYPKTQILTKNYPKPNYITQYFLPNKIKKLICSTQTYQFFIDLIISISRRNLIEKNVFIIMYERSKYWF